LKTASDCIPFVGTDFRKPLEGCLRKISAAIGEPSFILMAWSGSVDCRSLQRQCKKILHCPFLCVQTPAFFTQKGLMTDGLGIWAVAGEDITASTLVLDDLSEDSWISGEKAAERFLEKNPKPGTFIHFPEFFSFDTSSFLHGFHGRTGPGFRHVGGMVNSKSAGGNCYFTEKGGGDKGGVIALIEGLSMETDSAHGFSAIGVPVILTKTEGTRILELDFMPAAERYKDVIRAATGNEVEDIALYPLGIPGYDGRLLVRDLAGLNEDGSIQCGSRIPELSPLSILSGTITGLLEETEDMCEKLKSGDRKPRFALAFDCVTRAALLKDRLQDELALVKDGLHDTESLWGILSCGEICDTFGSPMFLNKSLAVGFGG